MSKPSARSSRVRALAAFLAVAIPSAAIGAMGDDFVQDVRSLFDGGDDDDSTESRLLAPRVTHDAAVPVDLPRQAEAIRRALDADPPTGAMSELIQRLGIVGDDGDVERLLPLTEHPHMNVHTSAMWALGRLGSPRGVDRLATIARSNDSTRNSIATQALGFSGAPEAATVLEEISKHPDQWRRQQALEALALRGGSRARRIIHRAFRSSGTTDAWSTAGAVATLGADIDRRLLILAATTPHDPRADAAMWALATLPGPETDRLMIDMARNASPSRRSTALSVLGQSHSPEAVEVLLETWDTHPNHRYDVIAALGASKAPGALDALLSILDEGRPDQAVWFADALASRTEQTAREVLKVLAAEDGPMADAALSALSRTNDEALAGLLVSRFDEDGKLPPPDTLLFLATHGGDAGWELIEEVLAEGTSSDRNSVVWALQARGDEDAVVRLLDLVDTGDAWTASSAMGALEAMGDDARDGLRGKLMERLDDAGANDFDAIASTLARLGGDEVRETLVSRLADGTETERWSAVSALGQMDDPGAREALEALLDDEDPTMRSTALSTLMWSGSQQVSMEAIDKALADEDDSVRSNAVTALSTQSGPEAMERLLALAEDEDATTRTSALTALANSGDPAAEELLIDALDDPDAAQTAMWGLQSMGTPAGAEAIRELAVSGDETQRLSAIGMLGSDPSREAGEVLATTLRSDDLNEASTALYALQSRGNTASAEAIAELMDSIDTDDEEWGSLRWSAASALQAIGGRVARERSEELEEILGYDQSGLMDMGDFGCDYGGPGMGGVLW